MKNELQEPKFVYKNWRKVRDVLQDSKPKARGGEPDQQETILRDYFGEKKFIMLRDLSQQAAKTRKELGNVIVLPGIMGSHLSVIDNKGDEDHIWVNLWRIVKGDMKRLKLKSDGKTNAGGETVTASGVIGWYYALALETLQAEPFPYDWRLNLCDTADKLAAFVEEKLRSGEFGKDEEIHFVAHSMGGLVVRNFIRQHKDLWNSVKGRLVMLGTPNAGSLAAVQGLMGKNQMARYLSYADVAHSPAELSKIINSFFGLYQLCPTKSGNDRIYEKAFWHSFPDVLFDDYLTRIPDFHQNLLNAAWTIDAERMSYIAGIGFETPSGLKSLDNGGYDFETTFEGDGTVPHNLGLLDGITTYYTDEAAHSDLLNNRTVLEAVKDILQYGKTDVLTAQKPEVVRARAVRSLTVETDLKQTETIAREIDANQTPPPILVFDAEKKLLRSMLGGNLDADVPTSFLTAEHKDDKRIKFNVQSIHGDVETISVPVIAVGQYQNLPPQGATLAVDEAIGYWVSYAYQNGMIGTGLGQLTPVPLNDKRLNEAVELLVVAGMGEYNRFNRDDLRYLMMNVALSVLTLGYNRFATVLIGTGSERISIDFAVRSILSGVGDALKRQPAMEKNKFTVVLAEHDPIRHNQINKALDEIKEQKSVKNLEIEVEKAKAGASKSKSKTRPADVPADFYIPDKQQREVTRITIERDAGNFALSAVTSNAANPKREIRLQNYVVNEILGKLLLAQNFNEQEEYGSLLHNFLIPEEFQTLIDTNRSLVLVLNREAAAIPWEMVGYRGVSGTSNFGIDLNVTRQFTSLAADVPGVAPPLNNQFKALIIADPAEDPALRLAGARVEGERLKNFFIELKSELKGKIDFQFEARIGYEQCNIAEILKLIFNEEFDLVHFAGHGIYQPPQIRADGTIDPKDCAKSGWVFGREPAGNLIVLTAREIFRLRRVPRLVFANACFSSQLGTNAVSGNSSSRLADEQLAGLAEAFFLRGIENYIGAGWQVDDAYAVDFAKEFYKQTLSESATLGEAVSKARLSISAKADDSVRLNSTWGAYQHYGNAETPLIWRGR